MVEILGCSIVVVSEFESIPVTWRQTIERENEQRPLFCCMKRISNFALYEFLVLIGIVTFIWKELVLASSFLHGNNFIY